MKGFISRWQVPLAVLIVAVGAAVSWHIIQRANRELVYVPRQLSECQQAATKEYQCYAKYFADAAYSQSIGASMSEMESAYDSDEYIKSQCHQLAHVVGRTAFEKTGSLEKAYAEGDNFCWSGFYHGAIEHAITRLGSATVQRNASTICESFAQKERYSFSHFNCVHGLGHGLMAVAGYNLFNGLKLCDSTKTSWEQESCYGGVFMENVMVASRGDGTATYLDPTRPLYPCTDVQVKYKQQCYLMQTSYILEHNGYDFAKVFLECAKADTGFIATCYQSAGRDASGSTNSDVARTVANCRQAPEGNIEAVRNCMLGADRDFVSYYHDDQKAYELCDAFGADLVDECRADVKTYYSTF